MNSELRKKAFTSLLKSSKPGGNGIGLAIVNRIIESHGGEIKIRPNVKGTTFSVYIPTSVSYTHLTLPTILLV